MKKLLLAVMLCLGCMSAQAQVAPPTVIGVDEALLQWDASTVWDPQTASFPLERMVGTCSTSGAWVEIAQVPPTQLWYLDKTLARGVTYCYRVYRLGTGVLGKSAPSNMASKAIPPVPTVPANLRAQ